MKPRTRKSSKGRALQVQEILGPLTDQVFLDEDT